MPCTSPVSSGRLQYFFSSVVSFMHLPTQRGEQRLRHLGITSAAALIVGNMIGAGVITTSGFAPADLGRRDLVLQAWGVGGLLALCGALSCGTLARRIPESGGEYTLLSGTVHPLAGLAAGWVSLLAGFTAPIAAVALVGGSRRDVRWR